MRIWRYLQWGPWWEVLTLNFPDMEEKPAQLDWMVRNPSFLSEANRRMLPVSHLVKLEDVSSNRGVMMKFDIHSHTVLGVCVKKEHTELGTKLWIHRFVWGLVFVVVVVATTLIQTKQRNRLEKSLIAAENDQDPQWSTSPCSSLNCKCNLSKRLCSMQLQCRLCVYAMMTKNWLAMNLVKDSKHSKRCI